MRLALEHSEIDRVTVTGVPNVSITDTHGSTLYTGIDESGHAPEAGISDRVVGHAWVECGLLRQGQPGDRRWPPAQGSRAWLDTAETLKETVARLVLAGKLPVPTQKLSHAEKKQIAVDVFRECNRLYFSHPIIQDYVRRGLITSAPNALVSVQSAVLTDPIEQRDSEYDDYMRDRRD